MKILFICDGNVARSQEAEVFFNAVKPSRDDVATSAGVNVVIGKPIDPLVVEVMKEINLDMSKAERKFVDENMVRDADMIVSFKPKKELPDYVSQNQAVRYWEIADPRHQPIEFHRQVRDEIRERVLRLVTELK